MPWKNWFFFKENNKNNNRTVAAAFYSVHSLSRCASLQHSSTHIPHFAPSQLRGRQLHYETLWLTTNPRCSTGCESVGERARAHGRIFGEINKEALLSPRSHRQLHIIFLPQIKACCGSTGYETAARSVRRFGPDGRVLTWSLTPQCNSRREPSSRNAGRKSAAPTWTQWIQWFSFYPQTFSGPASQQCENTAAIDFFFFLFVLTGSTKRLIKSICHILWNIRQRSRRCSGLISSRGSKFFPCACLEERNLELSAVPIQRKLKHAQNATFKRVLAFSRFPVSNASRLA